jgi:hypothetical protein
MQSNYIQLNLNEILEAIGEDETKKILSSFSCDLNPDVEEFLKIKALEFSKRGFAKTHLVFWQAGSETELIGYYAIAQKTFTVSRDCVSRKSYDHIKQYGSYDPTYKKCVVPALLLGQIGKNYANGNDTLITGDELLKLSLDKIKEIQAEAGGRYTYLECEDKIKLKNFYERNGFSSFGKRQLDRDETNLNGQYLIQYLKKL